MRNATVADLPGLKNRELLRRLLNGCEGTLPADLPQLGCSADEIEQRYGLSPAAAERLGLALELGRRSMLQRPLPQKPFEGGADVYEYLAPRLQFSRVEEFWALYLDAKGRLLHKSRISQGTLTSSLVHPREVFAPALIHRAASVLVAHNHPSGDPEPSNDDRATTKRLCKSGNLLGIEVLDHIIIGAGHYYSFFENGII
ncbi:MAG: DNA repair protein RadC [Planctomycetes bacterium]|nr:DNA repair protein RadC [Planctomycetota bacterium]